MFFVETAGGRVSSPVALGARVLVKLSMVIKKSARKQVDIHKKISGKKAKSLKNLIISTVCAVFGLKKFFKKGIDKRGKVWYNNRAPKKRGENACGNGRMNIEN